MNKVLVSACLLGQRVRYDGRALTVSDEILRCWLAAGQIVALCPEMAGGLPTPRPPAEIRGGDGVAVLAGDAVVVDDTGEDCTAAFCKGAQRALSLCREHGVHVAVLTQNSPSCGSSKVYDGSFSGTKISGMGVTTALLRANGIQVFSQSELIVADAALRL